MQKKVLSEIDLHYGKINMPKGFEIDRDKLQSDILSSNLKNSTFPFFGLSYFVNDLLYIF